MMDFEEDSRFGMLVALLYDLCYYYFHIVGCETFHFYRYKNNEIKKTEQEWSPSNFDDVRLKIEQIDVLQHR